MGKVLIKAKWAEAGDVRQDVAGNIERLNRGELLDQTNTLSRG
jgi:hypothetical protein